MNRWGIPKSVEMHVLARDLKCVYCNIEFNSCGTRKSKASWEHIVNDVRIATPQNIALCCMSCNASKGAKLLESWLKTPYCQAKRISPETVADVVKFALITPPKLSE
jgi:5-methylcytosine-specific restriction endonuclease McrA